MTHLVCCDDVGKKGGRPIDKILTAIKTMVERGVAGRKIHIAEFLKEKNKFFREYSGNCM